MRILGTYADGSGASLAVEFGSFRDDNFYFSSTGVGDVVFARGGNDTIDESGYFQYVSDDFYSGGAGNDSITTRSGDDTIVAGTGNDIVYFYGNGESAAYGGRGYDIAYVHPSTDNHPTGSGEDTQHLLRGFEEIIYL